MLPTEQPRLFALVTASLAQYVKAPNATELEGWWSTCRHFAFADVERAIKAHEGDEKDGKHAPRPIDVKRRLSTGSVGGNHCAAYDPTGHCQYPGIFSDGTGGEGPWYCPWHRMDRIGPDASRWIEVSRNVPFEEARAKHTARMLSESQRAPGVVAVAQAMAEHGRRRTPTFGDSLPANLRERLQEDAA